MSWIELFFVWFLKRRGYLVYKQKAQPFPAPFDHSLYKC